MSLSGCQPRRSLSSWVWKYASKVDDVKYYCSLCEKELKHSGSTTNVLVHFRRKHPKEFKAASGVRPGDCQGSITIDSTDSIKEEDVEEMEIQNDIFMELPGTPLPIEPPETATTDIAVVDDMIQSLPIVEFIYKDLHSPSTISSVGFRQLMQTVNCPLPSPSDLHSALINEYAIKHAQVTNEIRNAESVAISLEVWPLTSTRKCVTITGHFIVPSCELVSAVLSTRELLGALTWQNLVQKEFKEYAIQDKVTAIVAESSDRIPGVPEHVIYVQCFGELLKERIKHFLMTVCQRQIKFCKSTVAFILSDEKASALFEQQRKKANGSPLIPVEDTADNCFAWWSALERFLRLKDCITEASKR